MAGNTRRFLVMCLVLGAPAFGRADTILGVDHVSTAFGSPSQPTGFAVSWGPCADIFCSPGVFDSLGEIAPSPNAQTFDIHPSDDPDFAAVAAAVTGGSPIWFFSEEYPSFGFGQASFGVFAPGSTVDFFRLIISPFQIVDDTANSGDWLTVGITGPPDFLGYPLFDIYAEVHGTAAVPEPATLVLLGAGLLGLGARSARRLRSPHRKFSIIIKSEPSPAWVPRRKARPRGRGQVPR